MPAAVSPSSPRPADTTFDRSLCLPVATLTPTPTARQSHVEARVALVWPYSNSTATFALLLVDHASRGQVKVVFRNGSAKQVANTKVGIGDIVYLALLGCEWKETVDRISTPGKRLEWDLHYRSRLILQVHPHGQKPVLIDYAAPESDPADDDTESALRSTSLNIQPPSNAFVQQKQSTIQVPYLTPVRSARTSREGTFFDSSIVSLTDDDGYIAGRGRKRTKFARHSGTWNLIDNEEEPAPESVPPQSTEDHENILDLTNATEPAAAATPRAQLRPDDERTNEPDSTLITTNDGQDPLNGGSQSPLTTPPAPSRVEATLNNGLIEGNFDPGLEQNLFDPSTIKPGGNDEDNGTQVMGPPSTPFRQLRLPQFAEMETSISTEGDVERAITPRILPLASPGLPLVSPLIQRSGVEVGYFPTYKDGLSELADNGENDPNGLATDSLLELPETGSTTSDDSLIVIEERSSQAWEPVEEQQRDPHFVEHNAVSFDGILQTSGAQETTQTEPSSLSDQWLSTLEASIAQELSNDAQSPTIDIEIDHAFSSTEVSLGPLHHVPGGSTLNRYSTGPSVMETEDLYGAPEDEVAQISRTPGQIPETENDKVAQLEHNFSEVLPSDQQADIIPVDLVGQILHSPLVLETQGYEHFPLASQDRDERRGLPDSLDGNIDSLESLDEDHIRTETHAETTALGQINVSGIENTDEVTSRAVETGELVTESLSTTALISEDLSPIPTEIGSQAAPSSAQVPLNQSQVGADNTQLPTPDQTQEETPYSAHEREHDHEHVQFADQIAPPSPQPTQKLHTIFDSENEPDKAQPPKSPSETHQHALQAKGTGVAPPRSSQRLSSRNADMLKSISSPYFTPRRSARFSTSPTREENIPLSSPQDSTFLSSPHQRTEKHQEEHRGEKSHLRHSPPLPARESLTARENGLLTPLGYYARLSSLHQYFGQLLDVIAVCSTSSTKAERAKAGPKDYHTSMHLVDPTCDTDHTLGVLTQVFRPVKKALPVAQAGDIVILHNFKVHTVGRRFALLSSESSSWSVITFTTNSDDFNVVTSGPPLEQGSAEADYALSLSHWWDNKHDTTALNETVEVMNDGRSAREPSDGPATRTRFRVKSSPIQSSQPFQSRGREETPLKENTEMQGDQRSNSDAEDGLGAGQLGGFAVSPSQPQKSLPGARRRRANMTDNISNEADKGQVLEDSDLDNPPSPLADRNERRGSTTSTAPSTITQTQGREFTPRRSARIGRSPSIVHELRDGTKYVDNTSGDGDSLIHELRDGVTYIDE